MTELEKRDLGLWYDANYDPQILSLRQKAEILTFDFNHTSPAEPERLEEILKELLPYKAGNATILPPFYTDYGNNCRIGERTFINHGAYLMDCAEISIGKDCFIGPFCGIYTAAHPLLAPQRNTGLEKALPVVIEDNVWLGGSVTLLPGVRIGSDSVIGAGSVVTKDIPSGVIAAGNPCRIIRRLSPADSIDRN